jgi:PAS domain S-box-containing protein
MNTFLIPALKVFISFIVGFWDCPLPVALQSGGRGMRKSSKAGSSKNPAGRIKGLHPTPESEPASTGKKSRLIKVQTGNQNWEGEAPVTGIQPDARVELEYSNSLLQAALDSTADGLLIVDKNGQISQFNRKFRELWSIPESVLAGRQDDSALSFVLDQLKEPSAFLAKVKDLYSHPKAESFDVLEFKDGRIFERYSQPQRLGGKIVGRVWSFRDMTDRRRAEEALSKSEAELRALVEQVPAIIYTESAEEPGRTIYISPQIEAITGYASASWMDSPNFWNEIVHPDDIDYLRAEDDRTNLTGEPFRAEYRIYTRDRHILWMQDEAVLVRDKTGKALFWQGVMHDISDKKRAEEAMRASEEKFREVMEQSSEGIVIADHRGRIVDWNRKQEEITGYGKADFLGRPLWEVQFRSTLPERQTPALLAQTKERILQMLKQPQSELFGRTVESRICRKDGTIRDIEASVYPIHLGDHYFLGSVTRDITDSRRVFTALRESETRYRTLAETAHDLIFILDREEKIEYINEYAAQMMNLPATEIIGRRMEEISGVKTLRSQKAKIRQVIESGESVYLENEIQFPGRKIWLGTWLVPIKNDKGEMASILGISRDITERINAEKTQQESQFLVRTLFDLSPDAIVVIDPNDPKVSWPIIDCNAAACQMNGYSRDELIGQSIDILNGGSETPQKRKAYKKRLREEGGLFLEAFHVHKNGTKFPIEISTRLVNVGGRELVIGVDRDITARKRAEEALRENEGRFREIFENMSSGVVVYEPINGGEDFRINSFNRAAEKIENISRNKVIGKLVTEAFPGVKEFGLFESLQQVWQTGKPGHLPISFYKDRRITGWRENYLARLPSEKILVVYDDVTERKQAEENLVKTEQIYRRAITQAGSVPYQSSYRSEKYTFLGEGFEKLTGYAPEEMTTALFTSRLRKIESYGEYKNLSHEERVKRARQGRMKEWREDYVFERKDGVLTWLADHSVPLFGENGRVTGTLGILTDITERKQAEVALRESEELFRKAFVTSPDCININRLEDGLYVDINDGFTEITGYTRQETVGKTSVEINIWADPADRNRLIKELHERGEVNNLEARFRMKDGRTLTGLMSAKVIMLKEVPHILSITRNIEEKKRAEAELARQAEELRRSNEELARLYRASGALIASASFNIQEQAQNIVEVLQQEFGQDNCSLFVTQPDSNELVRLAVAGPYADQVRNVNLTLDGPGLVARAVRQGETLNVPDVHAQSDYLPNWDAARSELTIPLKMGNNVIGVIDLQSSQANAFGPDHERPMTIFAERAALVLEHGRLNTQMETRIQQLVALRTIDMAISASFDLNLTLGVLLDQVLGQLEVDAADILIYNPAAQTFKFACERGFRLQTLRHVQLKFGSGFVWRVVRERQVINIPDITAGPDGLQRSPDLSSEHFVTYLGVPLVAKGQIRGVLEIFNREPVQFDAAKDSFLEILAGQAAIAIDNSELFENLQSSNTELSLAYEKTLEGWANALEMRDQVTVGHTRRTTELTVRLARAMGVADDDIVNFYRGALLHDIGKMGLPDRIVQKRGPLTEAEWISMRKHPQHAFDLLSPISYLRPALDIPYCHHERWDGSGYPRGLKGEQIPLAARIFAVVDVWDALISKRPYRKEWLQAKAKRYIEEQAGMQFDPEVVKVFLKEIG